MREKWRSILHFLACLVAAIVLGICFITWSHTPPSRARQIRPLLKELDDYYARHGEFPDSCGDLASFSKLTNQFKVYAGGSIFEFEIPNYDFTILINRHDYEIFFPVDVENHFKFVAWRYDSTKHLWQKGRFRVRFWGSDFGVNWKPSFP
jgi:hypothetical protein